jgi:hypothetical protein
MSHLNWKLGVGLLLVIFAMAVVWRLTRSVSPYVPPNSRDFQASGTVDDATARRLQTILDQDLNRLKIPGMQAYIRTADGKTCQAPAAQPTWGVSTHCSQIIFSGWGASPRPSPLSSS